MKYFQLLERAELIHNLRAENKGVSVLQKPDKVYLDNPNLIYALAPQQANLGAIRETFFYNQLGISNKDLLIAQKSCYQSRETLYSKPLIRVTSSKLVGQVKQLNKSLKKPTLTLL